uniref:KIAA1217 n=1 Tax=Callorhinchus milii TaxID=7868 RepID=A0A4W3GSY6_CALMI
MRFLLMFPDQGKSNLRVTSSEDADRIKAKENLANGNNRTANTKVARNIPRRHTVGGARSSKEALGMQPSEMERKREAFLEHLKQKYPHHATAIMGQQERLKEQSRSPKHLRSPQAALTDQSEHLSVASADSFEAMADSEIPNNFNRGTRFRTSLPVVRSTNQTKDRSLGVLYLQYGDEIKKIAMPNEITTMDTVHALFVGAFHQQLTMKVLESQNVAVYIKDEARNVYYELSDLRSIQDRALLKVYHKDPAHISFSHSSRAVNGDLRMQREVMYATKDAPHSFRHQVPGPGPFIHGPPNSPPLAHSMPPSPSRIPYNGGRAIAMPGSATVPRDILSSVPPSRSISPSHPGAILERRDVKPDEDLSNKNLALFRNEGLYADPYMFHDGRMSIASPHSGIPGDIPDHVAFHRPSVRPGNMYPNSPVQSDMMEQSMYRMKSRKYTDTYIPTVGSKTPPPSPQKMIDVRMMELHGANSHMAHTIQPDRSSPVRLMRKDSGPPALLETIIPKSRSNAPSPSISDVVPFSAEKLMSGFVASSAANDPETRARMIAMEKQIASLTGLVQSALFKGGNGNGTTNATAAKYSEINLESLSDVIQISTTCTHQLQVFELRRNVQDLRQQLQQLRFLQLQNQEMLKGMLKKAESEINSRVSEALKRMEDPLQRQRMLVEEERQKYLTEEEKIIQQLCGLEISIEELKKDCTSAQQKVTLKDVEEGAVALRHVGESLAGLKGNFPPLQNKMRAVLRVEVEAVKFLKEEPHKLESLLKRVKSMTDLLTGLRRLVTEGLEISKEAPFQTVEQVTAHHASLPQAAPAAFHETQNSLVKSEPQMVIHHIQSSSVLIQPTHHSSMLVHPSQSPPGIPKQAHNVSATVQPQAPSSSAVTKQCQESIERVAQTQSPQAHQPLSSPSTAQPASAQNLFIDEIHAASAKKSIYRKMSFEAAEREWEEKRHNINQYDGREFERLLEEAQANLMKAIPSLEVEPEQKTIQKPDEADGIKQLEEMPLPEKGTEKPMKSPPPPPPRRSYPPGSGLTTARSGEVVVTAKKDIITIIVGVCFRISADWLIRTKGQPYMQQITSFVSQQDSNVNQFHPQEWDVPTAESSQQAGNCSQQVVLRPKTSKKVTVRYAEDIDSSGSSGDETSSTDNIAFMITNTKVQALSSGEVNDLVNQSGEGIQTVSVDANQAMTAHQYTPQDTGNEAPEFCIDKKPVIIIFDEPMDIRSAYKRLSTIFESDEELEKMMAEERIEEENEDMEVASETVTSYSTRINNMNNNQLCPESFALNSTADSESGEPSDVRFGLDETKTANKASTKAVQDETSTPDCVDTSKNDSKKKFKFKFPKKQLAALTQAIRTGTKTGRKTLQVVVYEDEEEPDGTVKQHKESKRFEITRSKNKEEAASKTSEPKQHSTIDPVSNSTRTDQIRKNTYKTLDSLEQTIKQLETTISEMSPKVSDQGEEYVDNATNFYDSGTVQDESKSPADQSLLSSGKAPQQAKGKPPLLPKISTKASVQASNLMSPTSRMPVSVGSKTQQQRQQQQSNADKATKPKLQDPQRQFRQANGSAKKAGGESKATSPTLPASKIPALSPSSGKTSSISGPSSDTNSPSTSSKYALPATNFTPAAGRSTPLSPVSHIPSASNGSLKLHAQNPPLTGKSQHPSFPLHVPNGRSSSSSSSPSPVSPTSLIQGVKSIRTIHTASFASYKQQNSSQSKPSVATLKETA